MRTNVPEKLLAIVEEIDLRGSANLTRLAVLKKWFDHPGRLAAFGLWVARTAAAESGRIRGKAGTLLEDSKRVLRKTPGREGLLHRVDRQAARQLHARARAFHSEFERHRWGPVRIIHCWPILLVEEGLALYLHDEPRPAEGYKLAADFCQHYDSRFGNCLNGPSRGRITAIVSFLLMQQAAEEEAEVESP